MAEAPSPLPRALGTVRPGRPSGHLLLLGSAAIELLKQSSESLAGRIAYPELAPFDVREVSPELERPPWLRGGFPRSLLAPSDEASAAWRANFISTYLERDIPQLGPRIAAETLRRFWTMLAHRQGALLNASDLARSLGVDGKTVSSYLDLVLDLSGGRRYAVEVKYGLSPPLAKGFYNAIEDVEPSQTFVVYSGEERYPKGAGIEVVGSRELAEELAHARGSAARA